MKTLQKCKNQRNPRDFRPENPLWRGLRTRPSAPRLRAPSRSRGAFSVFQYLQGNQAVKFTYDDLQKIEKLRIHLDRRAAQEAIEIAEQFNAELDQWQQRSAEFFEGPDVDLLSSELHELEAIADDRRFVRFDLCRHALRLFDTRIEFDANIRHHLKRVTEAAAAAHKETQGNVRTELARVGLSGGRLEVSVNNATPVVEAREAWQLQRSFLNSLSTDGVNMVAASVTRIRDAFLSRFQRWVSELVDFQPMPQNPDPPPEQPHWRTHEPRISVAGRLELEEREAAARLGLDYE